MMTRLFRIMVLLAAVIAFPGLSPGAQAQDIVDEWSSIKTPPPPAIKSVTVDTRNTALLVLDFMNQNCGVRPRCVATVPAMKKLIAEARAAKVPVVYSFIANTAAADVMKDLAPLGDEPSVRAGPDKFFNTDLEKILKDKGIQNVIVTGTASNGAVLFTSGGAAARGMNLIVPVDGMSAVDSYAELSTIYTFQSSPLIAPKVTLTKIDLIKF